MFNSQLPPFETIEVKVEDQVGTIWLNRPEVHNAFNHVMVNEMITALGVLGTEKTLKILVIRGRGKSFCSGTDLARMQEVVEFSVEERQKDSLLLASCLQSIYRFPAPVISVGHGSVMGGGNGFLAAADFALCTKNTRFAFTEVTIGLVPAVISYFIIRRIGIGKARELMLSGIPFNGLEAECWGLVNYAVDEFILDSFVESWIELLQKNSLQAMQSTKDFILQTVKLDEENEILARAAKAISQAMISKDGREGVKAFIEKRIPGW